MSLANITDAFHLGSLVLVGECAAVQTLRADIDLAARSTAKVLITGETGTGKEIVARLIHRGSACRSKPFVTINCAGMPDSLLESELFGYARGSFTGAVRDSPGLLRQAHEGTVFLDEVGEMSLRMQALVLRFLETGEVQSIGGGANGHVDVRIVTATNRGLLEAVAASEFREDLTTGSTCFICTCRRFASVRPTSRCWWTTSARCSRFGIGSLNRCSRVRRSTRLSVTHGRATSESSGTSSNVWSRACTNR